MNETSDSLKLIISPNPAFNEVTMNFTIPKPGRVNIKILDNALNEIFEVQSMQYASTGAYQITTNITNLPRGINYCLLEFISDETKRIYKRFTVLK